MTEEKKLTGYPSIDKPWLKYYSEEAINIKLPEKTIYQYIYDNNKDYKNNIALNYFGNKITYGELFENIEKVAKAFKAIGIEKGDVVTIMSMHTPEVVYSVYALNRIGAVANMVYLTLTEKEIVSTIKNTSSKAIIVLNVAIEKIKKVREEIGIRNVIVVSPADSMKVALKVSYMLNSKNAKISEDFISFKAFVKAGSNQPKIKDESYNEKETALIVYTSGSTGEPKGVMLSNYNLNAVVHQYKMSGMEFQRGDTFFNMLIPFVGFGISVGMNLPLALGMEEILWVVADIKKAVKGVGKIKPKHFVSAPAILADILNYPHADLSNMITFAGGGESVSREKEEDINNFLKAHGSSCKFVTGYGMTEFGSTVCTGMNHVYKLGTLGIPLPAVNVKVVMPNSDEEVKYNEVGELCFNAPNTMLGYYKNEEATNEIIKRHSDGQKWLHTGDLGMLDEDGFIHYKGRIKRISMTKGINGEVYKIFPIKVEHLFEKHLGIKACGTIVVPHDEKINVLVSFVTVEDAYIGKETINSELMEYAKQELPEHHIPVRIEVLDELPHTQSGKVDYKKLEEMISRRADL